MLKVAALLFALAAAGGLALAILHFKKKTAPLTVALLHGLLAAAGLALFVIVALNTSLAALGMASLASFVVAALGGFVLFAFHLKNKPLPSALIIVHGLVAVGAFALLLAFLYSHQ